MKTNTLIPVIKAMLNDEEFLWVEFLLKKNNMRKNMI